MADNSGLLKIGLFAGAGFLAWKQGWFNSILGIGSQAAGPAAGTTLPSQPAAGAAVPPATAGPKLSDLYNKLVAAVAGSQTAGPDEYNALLTQIYPAAGPMPDPGPMFPGWTRPQPMPIATYWAATSAWLAQNKGLSGVNCYAGLAGLAQRRGW